METLRAHHRLLRRVWIDHGGSAIGTESYSFFVAFSTAEAAVSEAVQAQRELAAFQRRRDERVRVGMGIHTSAPRLHDTGYMGMDLHRAARIAAASHGGQIVVSAATAELVRGQLPPSVRLRDLGSPAEGRGARRLCHGPQAPV